MFTRKEEKMIHDTYFTLIRLTEQFAEVQSVNTGHCWNIFKNSFEAGNCVTLYHKHRLTDKYYHQHKKCRTVSEAVEQIKNHDVYVLEKQQEKKAQPSHKGERQLKVDGMSGSNGAYVPTIMLKGKWVGEYGFEAGDYFDVICENEKIIIKKR